MKRAVSVSGKNAVIEFEDSSDEGLDRRVTLSSISGNQMSTKGLGDGTSEDEVIELDEADTRTGDDGEDSDCD